MRGNGDAKQVMHKNGGCEVCLGPLPGALRGALWHGGQCSCTEKASWSNLGQKVRLSSEPLGGCGAQERLDRVFSVMAVGWWSQGGGPEGLARGC